MNCVHCSARHGRPPQNCGMGAPPRRGCCHSVHESPVCSTVVVLGVVGGCVCNPLQCGALRPDCIPRSALHIPLPSLLEIQVPRGNRAPQVILPTCAAFIHSLIASVCTQSQMIPNVAMVSAVWMWPLCFPYVRYYLSLSVLLLAAQSIRMEFPCALVYFVQGCGFHVGAVCIE